MRWSGERSDILNSHALAAEAGKLRFRIAEIVPLSKAIESGRMFGGEGPVSMD
ncbi:hypothetical protein [Paraburkholderia sp.]|uniref:hypothetical protein n=1 Tax=Paraburkholderia sp. TaxID=1926495 RepID=UPI003D6FE71A